MGTGRERTASFIPSICSTKKETVSGRMVVDFRGVNALMDKTQWRGNLDNSSHLDEQYDGRFYFVCGAKAGLLRMELDDAAQQLFAFSMGEAGRAMYKSTRAAFGPKVGPAEFQRRVEAVWIRYLGEGRRFMDDPSRSASGPTWG